jgi:hypothetical protein
MSRAIRLYPRAWRDRYGEELTDLVASRPLGISGVIDLARGALDAHRHPELVDPSIAPASGSGPLSRQRYEDLRVARRLGSGSLFGSALWIIGWVVAANGPVIGTGTAAYIDGMGALPILLAAMVLLAGGLLGQMIRLPARAPIARLGAVVAMVCGPLWVFGPWVLPLGILTLLGLVAVALGAWWSSSWSGFAALGLLASVGGILGSVIVAFGLSSQDPIVAMVLFAATVWLVVGATLQAVPDASDVEPDGPRDEPASGIAPA